MTANALKVQRDIIALETFTFASASDMLKNFFPSMVGNLKEFVGQFKANNPAIKFNADQKAFLKRLQSLNYLDIANFSINTPDGFDSDFPSYLADLSVAAQSLSCLQEDVLNPFSQYLAKLISSQDHKFDTSNYFLQLSEYGEKREKYLLALKTHFSKNAGTSTTVGKVVSRNADWESVLKFENEILKDLNGVNRTVLNNKVQEISTYLSLLVERVTKKELEAVSPEVTRSLAEGVYQVAQDLEAFSIVYYQALAITTSIDQFVGKINHMKA